MVTEVRPLQKQYKKWKQTHIQKFEYENEHVYIYIRKKVQGERGKREGKETAYLRVESMPFAVWIIPVLWCDY